MCEVSLRPLHVASVLQDGGYSQAVNRLGSGDEGLRVPPLPATKRKTSSVTVAVVVFAFEIYLKTWLTSFGQNAPMKGVGLPPAGE